MHRHQCTGPGGGHSLTAQQQNSSLESYITANIRAWEETTPAANALHSPSLWSPRQSQWKGRSKILICFLTSLASGPRASLFLT